MNDEFNSVVVNIRSKVKNSISKISIALDIWTQPGMHYSYLGVTAHYVTDTWTFKRFF